jgi:hypothetical protein
MALELDCGSWESASRRCKKYSVLHIAGPQLTFFSRQYRKKSGRPRTWPFRVYSTRAIFSTLEGSLKEEFTAVNHLF